MLIDPTDQARFLVELNDLDQPLPENIRDYGDALHSIVKWAREYLVKPHPELGRKGPVCPYAQGSLDRGLFYLTVYPGRPAGSDEIVEALVRYRDWFLELDSSGQAARYQTILVLFPDITLDDAPALIETSQQRLKADYVSRGLMIGEFHDGPPDKAGLWNEDFRPLRSPVPLLAIRRLVQTDFPFLRDDPDFVAAYLENFDDQDIPARQRPAVTAAATRFGLEIPGQRSEPSIPAQSPQVCPRAA